MKFISIVLSILVLSLTPCSDEINFEDQSHNEISANHNHHNDTNDTCPITCICNCCGIVITYQPNQTSELFIDNEISTDIVSVYRSIYKFNFLSNIWQPPQLIS